MGNETISTESAAAVVQPGSAEVKESTKPTQAKPAKPAKPAGKAKVQRAGGHVIDPKTGRWKIEKRK